MAGPHAPSSPIFSRTLTFIQNSTSKIDIPLYYCYFSVLPFWKTEIGSYELHAVYVALLMNDYTNLYETRHAYHATSAHLNNVLYKSFASVCATDGRWAPNNLEKANTFVQHLEK
jgi:hypothetical protein